MWAIKINRMKVEIRNTADDSLGAISMGDNKSLKVWLDGGKRVVELVDTAIDDILDVVEEGKGLWHKIKYLFDNLFNTRFPCVIRKDGVDYTYTLQPAPWEGVDKAMYLSLSTDNKSLRAYKILFIEKHKNLQKAKDLLYEQIKTAGYTK
jgi:hypothetical protein